MYLVPRLRYGNAESDTDADGYCGDCAKRDRTRVADGDADSDADSDGDSHPERHADAVASRRAD
jgi:hypothetical protein